MKNHGFDVIIRGLRSCSDFEYERQMALSNRNISGVETLFLMASEKYSHLESSLIREIGSFGHRLKSFVPDEIEEIVSQRLAEKN